MKYISLLLLASCAAHPLAERELPVRKQKQKIASLQKKLDAAQTEEEKIKKELSSLTEEISFARLALIRKQVDEYEKKMVTPTEPSSLFLKERELLYDMIENGPVSTVHSAEALLDRILRIITEVSDHI